MGRFVITGLFAGGLFGWVTGYLLAGVVVGGVVGVLLANAIRGRRNSVAENKQGSSEQLIKLKEEQLEIKKERVTVGDVTVRKEVVEEEKTFKIPVRREEMVIEVGDEEELRIPVKEEEVEITKHPVRIAEVDVSKRQVEELETVKVPVKKEDVHVDVVGQVDVKEE
ncbi:YsnF/AvaK domain-containing protein [Alteribacter aurantiacus]|uniref:YsnF/AvaK domain-containing protein n=1 Tax=Alteribacter aurantiacus TaxID=254410 RepID=UPI0004048213|nr:YsnF/AvaK domain-containing protein [Alteribacter aurantiacus]